MNYEYLWGILESLAVELIDKGVFVIDEIMDDLKSTKTLISIHRTEPMALEIANEIEFYLGKVESNLLNLAESEVGKVYADEYLKKIDEARVKGLAEKTSIASKFVSGIPKGKQWIRISISDLVDEVEIEKLLKKLNLSSKPQEDGYLLIYGKDEDLKALIKEVSKKIAKKR